MDFYDSLIEKLTAWGSQNESVRAIVIIGSRARQKNPPDGFSDLDLVLVVSRMEEFNPDTRWLGQLGSVWMRFTERTVNGAAECRVVFEGGWDVDIVLVNADECRALIRDKDGRDLLQRGTLVLLDKIGVAEWLPPVLPDGTPGTCPTAAEFDNLVHNFWFHTIWATKKLCRDELWPAVQCVDCYLKQLLLTMLEWQARATHGWDYDTWHAGRFLREWAGEPAYNAFRETFARCNVDDIARALRATMTVFRDASRDAAARMGYPDAPDVRLHAATWVEEALRGAGIADRDLSPPAG